MEVFEELPREGAWQITFSTADSGTEELKSDFEILLPDSEAPSQAPEVPNSVHDGGRASPAAIARGLTSL